MDLARLREAEAEPELPTGPRRARRQAVDYVTLAAAMFGEREGEDEDADFSPSKSGLGSPLAGRTSSAAGSKLSGQETA